MDRRLPLSSLLSQALVAFTIEFDNEFEHLVPHRTTDYGGVPGAPWLVSMVWWTRWLRFIPDEGITTAELRRLSRTNARGMRNQLTRLSRWWRYVALEETGPGTAKSHAAEPLVRPTSGGRKAIAVWGTLTEKIEKRWETRIGIETVDRLRESLGAVANRLDPGLPDFLPILGYGLFSIAPEEGTSQQSAQIRSLPGLLANVLLGFAIEFEAEAKISLAIAANVLRVLEGEPVPARDLPRLSGVSKEALAMATGWLQKHGLVGFPADHTRDKGKAIALTAKGRIARQACCQLVWAIENRWTDRFGREPVAEDRIEPLRATLERLLTASDDNGSLIMQGVRPYSDGWRASLPAPQSLPHFPMILHRGGFPDGS
jgi:hypothetical protein